MSYLSNSIVINLQYKILSKKPQPAYTHFNIKKIQLFIVRYIGLVQFFFTFFFILILFAFSFQNYL